MSAPPASPAQARARRSRLRVIEAATELFAEKGYEGTSINEVARRAEVSVGLACRYFPSKEHLALALYDRLAVELAHRATELPEGTMAERFEQREVPIVARNRDDHLAPSRDPRLLAAR